MPTDKTIDIITRKAIRLVVTDKVLGIIFAVLKYFRIKKNTTVTSDTQKLEDDSGNFCTLENLHKKHPQSLDT